MMINISDHILICNINIIAGRDKDDDYLSPLVEFACCYDARFFYSKHEQGCLFR